MHSEQRSGRLWRQFRVSLRHLEQRLVLLAELDVAQLPVNRRPPSVARLELAIASHGNAIAAEPERAGDMPAGYILLDRILCRRDPVDRFLSDRFAQQIGVAEERELFRKGKFDYRMQLRQDDITVRAAGT